MWTNCLEVGGILQYGPFVCREFNKSCIVGNEIAIQIIKEKEEIKINIIGLMRMLDLEE